MVRDFEREGLADDAPARAAGRRLLTNPEWNIDLRSVRYAIVAGGQLSFHRAAAVLGTDQSVVSRKIRGLEERLGVSLFERNRTGVRLTHAGKAFIDQAKSALGDLDYAVKSARSAGTGSRGQLRIGFFCSLATGFLRELLMEFAHSHKTVTIDVSHGAPRDHIQQIRNRAMDVAFCTGLPDVPDCDVELLWHERVFCVVPENHPLALVDAVDWSGLRNERFIVSRDEPGPEIHDYLIARLATLGYHPQVRRLSVCRENLIHLVAMRFGLTLTSESTTATPFRGVVFKPMAAHVDLLPCVGFWSPANDNPALRRFLSLARTLRKMRGSETTG